MEVINPENVQAIGKDYLCKTCQIKLYPVKYLDDMVSIHYGLKSMRTFDEEKQKFQHYSYCERCFTLYRHKN